MWTEMSNPAILEELGRRFKEHRLRRNLQQKDIAESSGVSVGSIIRFEKGGAISTENFIRLMRTINLLENLEQILPEEPLSPILMKKLQNKKRKRATSIEKKHE